MSGRHDHEATDPVASLPAHASDTAGVLRATIRWSPETGEGPVVAVERFSSQTCRYVPLCTMRPCDLRDAVAVLDGIRRAGARLAIDRIGGRGTRGCP